MQGYEFLWLFVVLNCYVIAASESNSTMKFTINRSWDGAPRRYNVDIELRQEKAFVIMEINAPFFNGKNPGGNSGKPFPKLWEHEVVEAFFLGSDNMYLEVEFAPHGQHLVLFLAGRQNAIKMELPLKYTAKIKGNEWNGRAEIPLEYFPPNVSLFNAFAIHGLTGIRDYDALYPARVGVYENPDFHRLHLFQSIDFNSLVYRDGQLSKEWKDALDEAGIKYDEKALITPENTVKFTIDRSWDGDLRDYSIDIYLSQGRDFVIFEIIAPFFNDPNDGGPYPQLWVNEVVEAIFLGSDNMYLEVQFTPHGQQMVLFLAGPNKPIRMELPLKYTSENNGEKWYGRADIPVGYFPPYVILFNAFAIHGEKEKREYDALYPAEKGVYEEPDFHRLHLFKIIDFGSLAKRDVQLSKEWKAGLDEARIEYSEKLNSPENMMKFKINRSWDGDPRYYSVDIKLRQEKAFVIMEINAPFFNDPNPGGTPGKAFPQLWLYEVVEAFFLGPDHMYLEVEFAPHGQHLALFLAGPKKPIKMKLPLNYTSIIYGNKWYGRAEIPVGYFPPNVNLFNAYAIHGEKEKREYDAFYPAEPGVYEDPDFHRFHLFKPIDFDSLVTRDVQLSNEWKDALDEAGIEYSEKVLNSPENTLELRITTDWEGNPVNHTCVTIKLRPEGKFVFMEIFSPFYVGRRPAGYPFPKLWEYEIVQAFFLGSSTMYLEVECSPYGECLVIFLASPKTPIKMSSTEEYAVVIKGCYWTGKVKIPVSYFPPCCTLFNAYAVYGPKKDRRFEALYPADRNCFKQPNVHRFQFFKEIDFKKLIKRKNDFSVVWKRILERAGIQYDEKKFYRPKAETYDIGTRELTNEELYAMDSILESLDYDYDY